jgi:hypothetical protein
VTREEAKRILLLYRSRRDLEDAEIRAAVEQAQRDPELQRWFGQHCAAQRRIRDQFAKVPVPRDLKGAILAGRKIVRPLFWRRPAWLAAAASIAILTGIGALWSRPKPFQRFDLYRSRMVSTVWREYRMDISTNDLPTIRAYLAQRGAPTNYVVPPRLEQLSVTGGGRVKWGNQPVAMVCFDRGDQQMLFLFVVSRDAIKGEPGATPEVHMTSRLLQTASWSDRTNVYVLAGPPDPDFVVKYGPGQ